MRELVAGLVLDLFRRYHLGMRLESFSVEELTLMVDALLDFIRRYTPRRKSDDEVSPPTFLRARSTDTSEILVMDTLLREFEGMSSGGSCVLASR